MSWLESFWIANGDTILVGILILVGGAVIVGVLLRAWKILAMVLSTVLRFVYFVLIGWWVSKVRRWVTGSPW